MKATTTQQFYTLNAPTYEADIVQPAFRHFAAAVASTAAPQAGERALDVGTGTGILARLLAPRVAEVVGIDLAPSMIQQAAQIARGEGLANVRFEAMNAESPTLEAASFDLIAASFGLNACHPRRVLPALRGLLRPGGRLVFHEWSLLHPLDQIMSDTLAEFILDDSEVSEGLYALREYTRAPRPWDQAFQTAEDYQEELVAYGFGGVQVWEEAPVDCVLSPADFMRYKLAWANRQAELGEMDEYSRADFLDTLRGRLWDQCDGEGGLHYAPVLFRVVAVG